MNDYQRGTVIEDLTRYVIDLEDLVRWLARPYGYWAPDPGGADPVFVQQDPIWMFHDPLTNQPLEANVRLANTWSYVMHRDLTPEVPSEEEEDNGKDD